jgi:streptogramin lyase
MWGGKKAIRVQAGRASALPSAPALYTIPIFPSGPWGITKGPDGNLWFTEIGGPAARTGLYAFQRDTVNR